MYLLLCWCVKESSGVNPAVESVNQLLWRARRQKGLTQTEVARLAGCSQSAVSMWESGRADALAKDKVELLAKVLGVDLGAVQVTAVAAPGAPAALVLKYCSVDDCPSCVPYAVHGQVWIRPRMVYAPASEATRCSDCGQALESRCPNPECEAEAVEGSFCPRCGTPYVASAAEASGPAAVRWADEQRQKIAQWRDLVRSNRVS
jgi:transcriptional regulator with XRE-family HTH domain